MILTNNDSCYEGNTAHCWDQSENHKRSNWNSKNSTTIQGNIKSKQNS